MITIHQRYEATEGTHQVVNIIRKLLKMALPKSQSQWNFITILEQDVYCLLNNHKAEHQHSAIMLYILFQCYVNCNRGYNIIIFVFLILTRTIISNIL